MKAVGDFINKNTDKLLVLLVLGGFYSGAYACNHYGFKELAGASIDLVKQFSAAFLTLAVGARLTNRNGDTNGAATSTSTVDTSKAPDAGK